MRWRRNWPERAPRPRARRLTADEQRQLLAKMTAEVARSPVLSAFGIQVHLRRGRFYVERPTPEGVEGWGRITPVEEDLLLEVERASWKEVARGAALKLIKVIAGGAKGTFHGLGSLDKSLRKAGQGLTRRPMNWQDNHFVYVDTGEDGSVQEALFHFFGLPVEVIAQPEVWYSYHRKPHIVKFSKNRRRVLVRFSTVSMSGEDVEGTCLYAQRDGEWGAYRVRPSASQSIATAEAWLVKRKWEGWR